MYLHLGGNVMVRSEEILSVCDLDNVTYSHVTRETLRKAEKEGRLINAAEDLPKSLITVAGKKGEKSKVYLSQLNSATLLRRAESNSFE